MKNNQNSARALIVSAVFIVLYWTVFASYVHHAFQGKYWGVFTPDIKYGPIPELETEKLGMYPTTPGGWDSQYYYYMSNDPLASRDIPYNDPYRYQKIGVPGAAYLISRLAGYDVTPPIVYNAIQFFLVFVGVFYLSRYLLNKGISQIYVYGWVLSVGTLNALFFGMPDASADAMFIVAVLSAVERRLFLYALASSYLVLIREAYSIIPLVIALMTWVSALQVNSRMGKKLRSIPQINWPQVSPIGAGVVTLLPVILVISWATYIAIHFKKAGVAPGILGWPIKWPVKLLLQQWAASNMIEVVWIIVAVAIMVLSLWAAILMARKEPVWIAVIPYVCIIASLNEVVWGNLSGYMKAMGSLIVILIVFLPEVRGKGLVWLMKFFLIGLAIGGVWVNYGYKKDAYTLKYIPVFASSVKSENKANLTLLASINYIIQPIDCPKNYKKYNGFFTFAHKDFIDCEFAITNKGATPWFPLPENGNLSIHYIITLRNDKNEFVSQQINSGNLEKAILPGEKASIRAIFPMPSQGNYEVRGQLVQDGGKNDTGIDVMHLVVQ